jgi:PD-(D/E)XK endonuclease
MRLAASGNSPGPSSRIPSGVERMFPSVLTPREQGDRGERAALHWIMGQGAHVAIPFGHSPHYDLVADFDADLLRVQVKTSACRHKERWAVTVCTRGGNQSWQGLVKRLDPSRFEYLFVLVGDGRQWFIPADRIEGAITILLGGPKYAEFEVERGDPIPSTSGRTSASTIEPLDPRGDVRVAKGVAL